MKIQHLELAAADCKALSSFYRDLLELPVTKTYPDFSLRAGHSTITFRQASPGINPHYHFAFNIPFDSVESARNFLQNRVNLLWIEDHQSDIAEFVSWKARSLYFFDSAGNIVELIGRKGIPERSGGIFRTDQILSVSEIGLVWPADLFDKAVGAFIDRYNLSYFSRQPPLPGFRAVGDDEGLFIAVPEGRTWYPTKNTMAEAAPMQIRFIQKGEIFHYVA